VKDNVPRKITFLIDSLEVRAGTERVTVTVAGGLASRSFDVEIVTLRGNTSSFPVHERVKLVSLGFAPGELKMRSQTWPLVRAIRGHVRRRRPDVLVAVDPFLSVFAFPALLGSRARRIAWEHQNFHIDFGMRSRRLGRRLAALLSHDVAVLTGADAGYWRRAFPRMAARLHVMPNPLPFAPPAGNPYSLKSRTALAVGRFHHQKGFNLLLEAWASVEADFPEWSLKVIGSGDDYGDLRRQLGGLNLQRATLVEPTAQIEREYLAAGVFCLSSRHEGLPMVLMESQIYGVPAVAFDCPTGPADLLAPGGGLLVEPENVAQFAAALRRVLADPALRGQLSQRAYAGAHRYEAQNIFDQWTRLLLTRQP